MNRDKQAQKRAALAKNYTGVKVIRDLDAVRERPGMYLGSPRSLNGENPEGLIHIAQEILSNAIDEAYAGFGDEIQMIIHPDNSMTVIDHGRGLPTGGKDFKSAIETFTKLHSSGKFDDSNYANALGTNGLGTTICNATSKYLDVQAVTVLHEHYHLRFNQKQVVAKEFLPYDRSMHTGTTITFLPDDTFFDTINWDDQVLINMVEQSAFLTPHVRFDFIDERQPALEGDTEHHCLYRTWLSQKGMSDYVAYLSQTEELVKGVKHPIAFNGDYQVQYQGQNQQVEVQGALIYTNSYSNTTFSFVNGGATKENGTHVDGAYAGISKAFRDFLDDHRKDLKFKKNQTIDAQDTREGLILALLIKLPEALLIFDSQTKTHLVTPEAKKAVYEVIYQQLTAWLSDHPRVAKAILENMVDSKKAREEALKSRQAARKARKTKSMAPISPKLKPATSKDSVNKTLYVTEGDSASSLLAMVRDKRYQAVFPIRGKILNTASVKLGRALSNEEIATIARVIGAGIGKEFDVNQMEYDKIIITSDADDDGAHIASLLITLFYTFFPGLIEGGHLYRVISPLYLSTLKDKNGYEKTEIAYDESEHLDYEQRVQADLKAGYQMVGAEQRFKGLGSLTPELTQKYLADPRYRKLLQIKVDDEQATKHMLAVWMGKNADLRKDQIAKTVNFDDLRID